MTHRACKFTQTSADMYCLLGHSSKRFLKFFYKNLVSATCTILLRGITWRFPTCNTLTQQYTGNYPCTLSPLIFTFSPTLSRMLHTITIHSITHIIETDTWQFKQFTVIFITLNYFIIEGCRTNCMFHTITFWPKVHDIKCLNTRNCITN
jgi:hypothetical protein